MMNKIWFLILVVVSSTTATAGFQADVDPLIQASCVHCHDAQTDTGLNLESIGHDLSDPDTFRAWEKIFDRLNEGEMPPASEPRPDTSKINTALTGLNKTLKSASVAKQRRIGRVPARRLTKVELGYTLRDLLLIESDVTLGIPDEVESESFDTVGSGQRISAVHLESYLRAADEALRLAIHLGENPFRSGENDFTWLEEWHDKPIDLGGSVTRRLQFGAGIALFRDIDYLTQFQFGVTTPGIYRLSARVAAYQSDTPVTAKLIVKNPSGEATLVKSVDLEAGEPTTLVVETFLKPGDTPYLTFDMEGKEPFANLAAVGGSKHYKGRGMAIMSQKTEGPVFDSWPPPSTRQLFSGWVNSKSQLSSDKLALVLDKKPDLTSVAEVVKRIAPRVFRRPVSEPERMDFVNLASPAIEEGRDFLDVLQIVLRSMLSSPQFLMFAGQPGELDDFALANRLSYFFWKSMPDEELFELAQQGKLTDSSVLAGQVERMLADEKSKRFVKDFLGQWLRLHSVNATTPDDGLYPEFDELLAAAIPIEPELFFTELIDQNLSLTNLVDSDFIFVNRRLATHYGITGVTGQQFRKVSISEDSPRGGILTQAAVLKTTANGTTTSPVMRGNFVLTNLLGTPPSPPPPGVGSIEPDTRGKTTIREILASHREIESCNQCHRDIDPPGFALESFDPIGGFRTHYRVSGGEQTFDGFTVKLPPRRGPSVDSSGITADGHSFSGVDDFKRILLIYKKQLARHFISQLLVYSTGGEIEFADRAEIETIVQRMASEDYPVRKILHEVVQSRIFRAK